MKLTKPQIEELLKPWRRREKLTRKALKSADEICRIAGMNERSLKVLNERYGEFKESLRATRNVRKLLKGLK